MMRDAWAVCATAIMAALCATASTAGADETAPTAAPTFTLQVSDFMTDVQLRHFKLWFGGSLRNWPLAQFELDRMRVSLEASARLADKAGDAKFADRLKSETNPAFMALHSAIEAKDEAAFAAGFARLTGACNACHEASGIGFVKMQTPTASPFSDQRFAP